MEPDEAEPTPASLVPRWVSGGVGAAAFTGAIVFLARRADATWDETRSALEGVGVATFSVALAMSLLGMVCVALGWRAALDRDQPPATLLAVYFVGEVGKYLPGGVWSVVGRAELARRQGVARDAAYRSVVLGLAALFTVCAGLVVVASPWLDHNAFTLLLVVLAATVVLAGVAFWWAAVHRRLPARLQRLSTRLGAFSLPAGATRSMLGWDVAAWALLAGAAAVLASPLTDATPLSAGAAMLLGWAVGFAVLPVPGGLGVREAVFVIAVEGMTDAEALSVALLARFAMLVVDGAGALGGAALLARRRPAG